MDDIDIRDRFLKGDLEWESFSPRLKSVIGPYIKGKEGLYDAFVPPVLQNLVQRSAESGDSEVYSKSDVDRIFEPGEIKPAKAIPAKTTSSESSSSSAGNESSVKAPSWKLVAFKPFIASGDETLASETPASESASSSADSEPSGKATSWKLTAFKPFVASEKQTLAGKVMRFIEKHKTALLTGAGALGAAGIAAAIAASIHAARKRRKKKEGATKSAGAFDWIREKARDAKASALGFLARNAVSEIDLADKAFRARGAEDYKEINDDARKILKKRMDELYSRFPGTGYNDTFGRIAASGRAPYFMPGDNTFPVRASGTLYSKGWDAAHAQAHPPSAKRYRGITSDPRLIPFTMVASTMLKGSYKGNDKPDISNMAYNLPFVIGQYAIDKGIGTEDLDKMTTNGLDRVFMDALKQQMNRYPAMRNAVSAYVNGGAGDVSDPDRFGIKRTFWDYANSAPTPEGTNTLRKVVRDIGAAGGYGGSSGDRFDNIKRKWVIENEKPYSYDKSLEDRHYKELLRFFDEVGPSIFRPKTVLGRDSLLHERGGLLTNAEGMWYRMKPYFDADPELVDKANSALGGGVIGDTVKKLTDKAQQAAEGRSPEAGQ